MQVPIPWLHILTSPAVWAIIIAHFCNNWGFYTLLTCMPTYFKQALPQLQINQAVSPSSLPYIHIAKCLVLTHFLLQSVVLAGVYSAIPYLLLALLVPIGGFLADIMRKDCISTTIVRKIMTFLGVCRAFFASSCHASLQF